MRNDARPIGEDSSLKSGEGPHAQEPPSDLEPGDGRNLLEREDQSHVENREGEQHQPDRPVGGS